MDLEDLEASATPAEMAAALDERKDVLHLLQHAHTQESSVREEAYRGHLIKVVTTIPNQEFPSMIGMAEHIIDVSIDLGTLDSGGHNHGGHNHDSSKE